MSDANEFDIPVLTDVLVPGNAARSHARLLPEDEADSRATDLPEAPLAHLSAAPGSGLPALAGEPGLATVLDAPLALAQAQTLPVSRLSPVVLDEGLGAAGPDRALAWVPELPSGEIDGARADADHPDPSPPFDEPAAQVAEPHVAAEHAAGLEPHGGEALEAPAEPTHASAEPVFHREPAYEVEPEHTAGLESHGGEALEAQAEPTHASAEPVLHREPAYEIEPVHPVDHGAATLADAGIEAAEPSLAYALSEPLSEPVPATHVAQPSSHAASLPAPLTEAGPAVFGEQAPDTGDVALPGRFTDGETPPPIELAAGGPEPVPGLIPSEPAALASFSAEIAPAASPEPAPGVPSSVLPADTTSRIAARLRGQVADYLAGDGRAVIDAGVQGALQAQAAWLAAEVSRQVQQAIEPNLERWVAQAIDEALAAREAGSLPE